MSKILQILYAHQDEKYGDFIAKLVPTLPRSSFIGIRSPEFKKILKEIDQQACDEIPDFLQSLPHQFQEENTLHVCQINRTKDYEECISLLENFLPYIDNWAISDGIGPKCFAKNTEKLIEKIAAWIKDEKPYTKRVAMLLIKKYFLTENYKPEYLEWAAQIRSEEYYVNMMTAWLFADALVVQWDSAVEFLKSHKLDDWTHNKAIQKAIESFRITPEQKTYLRGLKVSSKQSKQ